MDDPFRRTEAEQAHVIRDTSFGGSITGGNKEERRGERPEAACVREEHAGGWENLMPVMRK